MSNPVITPVAVGQRYQITESARVHTDLAISITAASIIDTATFIFKYPNTVSPSLELEGPFDSFSLSSSVSPVHLPPVNPSRQVSWTTSPASTPGQNQLQVEIQAVSGEGTDENWTLKVSGLPTTGGSRVEVQAGDNASITSVEADPIIEPLTQTEPMYGGKSTVISAQVRRNIKSTPETTPSGCSEIDSLTWELPHSSVSPSITPTARADSITDASLDPAVCKGSATVTLPTLTSELDLTCTLTATINEFSNTATAVIHARPNNPQHCVLIVDRSGSMSGTKWDNAVKGAYLWLDLFSAFRQEVNPDDRLGIMVFEDRPCGFRADNTTVDSLTEIVFPTAGALGSLPALPDPTSLSLGSPDSCTPIGDALIRALDRMVGLPGDPITNSYCLVLLTDGIENSGTVQVDTASGNPPPSGVEVFATQRSAGARNIFQFSGSARNIQLYTIGVGADGEIQPHVLDDLAYGSAEGYITNAPLGYYRLVSNVQDIFSCLTEMLEHYLTAASMVIAATPPNPSGVGDSDSPPLGHAAYFLVPANEVKLVVMLLWDATPGNTFELKWRRQPSSGDLPADVPFQTVPASVASAIPTATRDSHGIALIDLNEEFTDGSGTTHKLNETGTEWRVQYKPGGGSVGPIDTGKLLAARDLYVRTQIRFDRVSYRTEQSMQIEAEVRAGGIAITDARIVVELARPGESLGTFLATNSHLLFPNNPNTNAANSSLPDVFSISIPPGTTGDPVHPKVAMLRQLLEQTEMKPPQTPEGIFVDGTSELHVTQTQNGIYTNTYANTDMEGTYTFRFIISGQTPDGSYFADTITMSRWVGINVDPESSPVTFQPGIPTDDKRILSAPVYVTPKSRGGQFLGPFGANGINFTATNGSFQGNVISHPDGSYSRRLYYQRGQIPVVQIEVQGKALKPVVVASGCLGWFVLLMRQFWQWLNGLTQQPLLYKLIVLLLVLVIVALLIFFFLS